MDLDRPASRSGLHEQRPVTRWRREERPPSRSGITDDSSRYMGEDRPISRRGVKPEPGFHADRPMTQRSMVMRPPSASAFSSRITGTSSRLSSALMTSPHTGMGILPAQSSLRERDRLVSQQGLSGMRTGTARGPISRQVQDKRYFESLLQLKTRELANEVTRLRRQIESDSRDQATYLVYDKRVKEMAAELTELQGRLSDYNLLVDKINTGTERAEIAAETRELAAANQTEAAALEAVFTDRTRRQGQVGQLEREIQQERQTAEKLVAGMSGEMLEQYQTLRQDNERLTHQMELLQGQLDALTASRSGLQDQISLSTVKQEAVRLYCTLAELEGRRDTLLEEERNRLSPAEERDRLLSRVRQDNAEIASMERASAELREQIRQAELNLHQVNEELTESQSERHSKYLELRKREETMEEFLASWEATKEAEAARLAELEAEVVATLGAISRRLAALPSPADYLALEQDLASGSRTLDSLTADHAQLALYLNKVEVMEDKVKAQLAALTENLQRMQDEMVRLADLEGLRARAETRRLELTEERDLLMESRGSTMQALQAAREKQTTLENNKNCEAHEATSENSSGAVEEKNNCVKIPKSIKVSEASTNVKVENLSSVPLSVKSESQRHKLVVASDSQGKNLFYFLEMFLGNKFNIFAHVQPGAPLEAVLSSVTDNGQLEKFTKNDFLVLIGGCNNVSNNCLEQHTMTTYSFLHYLENETKKFEHTNLILATIPNRYDLWEFDNKNSLIEQINWGIRKLVMSNSHIHLLDLHSLEEECYTQHGLHINNHGKMIMSKQIFKIIRKYFK